VKEALNFPAKRHTFLRLCGPFVYWPDLKDEWRGATLREVRNGNGPARLAFILYWRRRDDENPTLKRFLVLLQTYLALPHESKIT
jgi:hypothetical protein